MNTGFRTWRRFVHLWMIGWFVGCWAEDWEAGKPLAFLDGKASSLSVNEETLFVGGNFTWIGPPIGHALFASNRLDGSVKALSADLAETSSVQCMVADGAGGWFLVGYFTLKTGVRVYGLIRVLADGTSDPSWNPDSGTSIKALAVRDGVLYIGGSFTTVNGMPRSKLAAFSIATKELLPWNPNVAHVGSGPTASNPIPTSNAVTDILVQGDDLIVCGNFSQIGGQDRTNLAAVDATTGIVKPWKPIVSVASDTTETTATSLSSAGGRIFVGETCKVRKPNHYYRIETFEQKALRAFDAETGGEALWRGTLFSRQIDAAYYQSGATVRVQAIGDVVGVSYGYDDFDKDDGRPEFTILDAASGEVAWSVDLEQAVQSLSAYGGHFFAASTDVFEIDPSTGALTKWPVGTDFPISELRVDDGQFYLAGRFRSARAAGQERTSLAALDAETGKISGWSPLVDGPVGQIHLHENTLYVSGNFTEIDGVPRKGLAAFNATTGELLPWHPNSASEPVLVNSIAADDGIVYLAGEFSNFDGLPRYNVAAVNAASGSLLAWSPASAWAQLKQPVASLALRDNMLFALQENRLSALDASTGAVELAANSYSSWGKVVTADVDGVYVCGGDNGLTKFTVDLEKEWSVGAYWAAMTSRGGWIYGVGKYGVNYSIYLQSNSDPNLRAWSSSADGSGLDIVANEDFLFTSDSVYGAGSALRAWNYRAFYPTPTPVPTPPPPSQTPNKPDSSSPEYRDPKRPPEFLKVRRRQVGDYTGLNFRVLNPGVGNRLQIQIRRQTADGRWKKVKQFQVINKNSRNRRTYGRTVTLSSHPWSDSEFEARVIRKDRKGRERSEWTPVQ